jgi:hypothetical protein
MIDVPPKIWRPKPKPCYTPIPLPNEFDDDLFVFPQYGPALCRPTSPFMIDRTNLRLFQPDRDMEEFVRGFRIDSSTDTAIAEKIRAVVQHRWDCFYEEAGGTELHLRV